jgi:hypothetical protein
MLSNTETFVLIGSIGLASWMVAGFISVIGYSHPFKPSAHVFALAVIILCGLGTILGAAMLAAIIAFA